MRGDTTRTLVIGGVTGVVAVAATALVSSFAPVIAFAMIPAYVAGFILAARSGGRAASLQRPVSPAVYERIASAHREVLRRQLLKKSVGDFTREDWLGKSPAAVAREIKALLDAE